MAIVLSSLCIKCSSIPARISLSFVEQKSSGKLSRPFLVRTAAASRNSLICLRFSGAVLSWPAACTNIINISKRRRHNWTTGELNAGFEEIEPDLNEDPKDVWATPGVTDDEFIHGEWDDHHTYFEGEEEKLESFWGAIAEDIASVDPPTGFQGLISWLFPPAVVAGLYFDVPGEYLYIGAAVFTIVFCIIEMNKPSEAHNFEPQIYNMERGARDKLISDYNTMDIWDFNEKYGDLWDFTGKIRDDIIKTN